MSVDLSTFNQATVEFIDWITVDRGLSPNTISAYRRDLDRFAKFAKARQLDLVDVDSSDVADFMAGLAAGELALSARSAARCLSALRTFYRFCVSEGTAQLDPTYGIVGPKLPSPIPKALTQSQVETLLDAAGRATPKARRDSAILELLYGTGMRISELVGLDVDDVDFDNRLVRCFGKGRKERVMPLGSSAEQAVEQYLVSDRPSLVRKHSTPALFLSMRGTRLSRQACWQIVRAYADRVGLGDKVSPHILRHCCATHMLENGADIRIVQEMLGHANITSTQIYTRVSQRRLNDVFVATHPRAQVAT